MVSLVAMYVLFYFGWCADLDLAGRIRWFVGVRREPDFRSQRCTRQSVLPFDPANHKTECLSRQFFAARGLDSAFEVQQKGGARVDCDWEDRVVGILE